jgi:hypothetical protein
VVSVTPRPRQGKDPRVPIGQEAGCNPEPNLTQRIEEKSFASAGDRPPVNQSVVKHYTDYVSLMMEAVRTSETSVDNHFTRQYIPEDNSEHYTD